MKLAFCLFNYFPYGGLQRDFLRIALACRDRGHDIHVYTMRWDGEQIPDFHLHLLKVAGWQNHTRCASFIMQLKKELDAGGYDLVIGFNKMPYLDLYYAADVCYQSRIGQRARWYRLLPRYKQWVALEKAVFARGNKTHVMLISAQQQVEYMRCYQTEVSRFSLLPPGIDKDRIPPANAADIRQIVRKTYHIPEQHFFLLMVGSGFKTKGLDRAIRGIAALPSHLQEKVHLMVIGRDNPQPFIKLAQQLQVNNRLQFLGGRSDVPHFLLAADLLLHPSYHENTGTVLLEAMVAGLPVLTVETCGYASYISTANAGMVCSSPFQQADWNAALAAMLVSPARAHWKKNALSFASKEDIFGLPEKAADLIVAAGSKSEFISTQ